MIYDNIKDVPYTQNKVIVINVGTRIITTLSLLAAIRNSGFRVLLIDCKYMDIDDWSYFKELNKKYDFDLIRLPLQEHGKTLDYVFNNLCADNILLVDSDLELRNSSIVPYMSSVLENPLYFGCGFRHGGWNLKGSIDYGEKCDGYYEERMWIPFLLLKVLYVREALAKGCSFRSRLYFNLFPKHQGLSRKLIRATNGKCRFSCLNFLKHSFRGAKPLVVLYDTGSELYNYLRYESNLFLAGMDAETGVEEKYLKHYNGVTRKAIFNDNIKTCKISDEYENIRLRLLNEYGFDIEEMQRSINF